MTTHIIRRRAGQLVIAVTILAAFSGCTALQTATDSSLVTSANASAVDSSGITLEIRATSEKKPRFEQVALDSGSTVQQVLEKAKLTKEFRRMNIQIVRMAGDQQARMDVKYEHTKGAVDPLYDYALYPGDYLIVREVNKTALDDMLESLTSPLGQSSSQSGPRRYRSM